MTNLTMTLSEELALKIQPIAESAGLTVEEWVQQTLEHHIQREAAAFQRASEYVMKKNTELYRRLA